MKRGTPDHWKMTELAKLLKLPVRFGIATANGIMERLWHYTAKYHPQGDIGSAPDWAIAAACGWDCGIRSDRAGQDSDKILAFIDALVVARWLDRDNAYRLLVHDWADHADSSVKKYLKDKRLEFLSPTLKPVQDLQPLPLPLPFHSQCQPQGGAPALSIVPEKAIPPDAEQRIRKIADQAPDQQDYEPGVDLAMQHLLSSANPATTLATMEANIPDWWAAMREGIQRTKPLRWVIKDRDYLRRPREPTKSKTNALRSQIASNPNPRLIYAPK